MSHGGEPPSQRFTAPRWIRATSVVSSLAFPAAATGLVLSGGWSATAVLGVALVPVALLGAVEAFCRRVELHPERLVVVANLRRRSYARSEFTSVRWSKGGPVALEYVRGGYLRLPEVGPSPASLAGTLRRWLAR